MTEHGTTRPQSGLDRVFGALRDIGIRRRTDDKVIAGVCSGLADRLGIDPVITRVALVLLVFLGGAGFTIYLVAWALLPNDKNELPLERALRHGDGGSVVLVVIAALSLFGGTWGAGASRGFPWGGWGFPWGLILTGLFIWWVVSMSQNRPDAGQTVRPAQAGTPYVAPSPAAASGASHNGPDASPAISPGSPAMSPGSPNPYAKAPPRTPRRRSGGPSMALLAFGLTLTTYGTLVWMGNELDWTGSHQAIALAGSLVAMGLLLAGLGVAGWRAGFVGFLTVFMAIAAWSASIVPSGIHFGGGLGDATWRPTSVAADANYQLGAGNGTLDLSGLPTDGLIDAKLPAYVGLGDLKVAVPAGLTVKVVGHVGLGQILVPGETNNNGQGGTDVSRTIVIGDGPTEVVVDAGVGIGQLTVVKE